MRRPAPTILTALAFPLALLAILAILAIAASGCAQGVASPGGPAERRFDSLGDGREDGVDDGGALPADDGTATFRLDGGAGREGDAGSDAGAMPGCTPAAESCNGRDDDCDGEIDDDAGCPCPTVARDGHSYMLCPTERAWPDARAHCTELGYELVSVGDAGEDSFVYGQIAARSFEDTWIGLDDRTTENDFRWVDGAPLVYTHWDEGEPNDGGGEDCAVIMTRSGRESEWDDRPCESARPYVCEAAPTP